MLSRSLIICQTDECMHCRDKNPMPSHAFDFPASVTYMFEEFSIAADPLPDGPAAIAASDEFFVPEVDAFLLFCFGHVSPCSF